MKILKNITTFHNGDVAFCFTSSLEARETKKVSNFSGSSTCGFHWYI